MVEIQAIPGSVLLGAIIEKASGKTYAISFQPDIRPLDESAAMTAPRGLSRAGLRLRQGNAGMRNAPYPEHVPAVCAGSLASSVDDLAT